MMEKSRKQLERELYDHFKRKLDGLPGGYHVTSSSNVLDHLDDLTLTDVTKLSDADGFCYLFVEEDDVPNLRLVEASSHDGGYADIHIH